MKTCSVEGCNRKHKSKGYCFKHYVQFKYNSEGGKPCKFPECKRTHFAKGYCKKHYSILIRKGEVKYEIFESRKCKVSNCFNNTMSKNGYCKFHYGRLRDGTPLDLPNRHKGGGVRERNKNWKGGIADYPNHREMQRVRLQVLKEANYTCQYCGKYANEIHHKDHSKDNHSKENLVGCCRKCNSKMRNPNKPTMSKYRRLYGYARYELKEMGLLKDIVMMEEKNNQI